MSRSKNSRKGTHSTDLYVKLPQMYMGYWLEGVSSMKGKKFFKRHVNKITRKFLNKEAKNED